MDSRRGRKQLTFYRQVSVSGVSQARMTEVVGVVLVLLSLSIDRIPLFGDAIPVQILPLSAVISLALLPWIRLRLRYSPLLGPVLCFAGYALVHSVVALFVDIVLLRQEEVRIFAWFRQVVGLVMGVALFIVLKTGLVYLKSRDVVRVVTIGIAPSLLLSIANLVWGYLGSEKAGAVVMAARLLFGLKSWPTRVSGFSLEPSYFSIYLALIGIPFGLLGFVKSTRKSIWFGFLALVFIAILATLSLTGWFVALVVLVTWMFVGPSRKHIMTISFFLGICSAVALGGKLASSYAGSQLRAFLTGEWTVSIIDRFYSAFGPFIKFGSSYVALGYGLGGTSAHFEQIVPEFVQEGIASVRWELLPNLNSLMGRILAETGVIGLFLFARVLWQAFRVWVAIRSTLRGDDNWKFLTLAAGPVMVATLVSTTIGGQGSFALPYLWFWLAVLDVASIKIREVEVYGTKDLT